MKKLFYVLAIAAFVACNNSAEGDKDGKDTIQAIDSAADRAKDSIEAASDSLKTNIDSAADRAKDSLRK